MKKIFVMMAVICGLSVSLFAAGGSSVSRLVLNAFQKEFAGAENARWNIVTDGLYRVSFSYDDKQVEAFFDAEGSLFATGRSIAESQLPLLVSKSLNARYAGLEKRDIVELSIYGETQYIVTIADAGKLLTVKAFGSGSLELYKTEK